MQPVTIVCFGDSITLARDQDHPVRWTDILQAEFDERYGTGAVRIINAGIGGNTSREGLARFDTDVLAYAPQLMTVEFGNDAVPDPERHVPVAEYLVNLEHFRTGLADACNGQLIPMTFPPLVNDWHSLNDAEISMAAGGPDEFVETYRQATREYADRHGLTLADLSAAMRPIMDAKGPGECILPDGVHLTAEGNRCVARTVSTVLAQEVDLLHSLL